MKNKGAQDVASARADQTVTRRKVIQSALGLSVGLTPVLSVTGTAATKKPKPPEKMRPQEHDILVFRFGDNAGTPIRLEDVPRDSNDIIQALPMDPVSQIIRDGSRLNGINLVRVEPELMSAKTQPNALEDIVAYSTVCTHQGCDLTQWFAEKHLFECYCHHSKFDAANRGKPSHGPARRKLAMLPLIAKDGVIVAAGTFASKVGFKK